MCKAEDVVDKEQNVRTGVIAELLCQRQTSQSDTHTRTWRLVHLAVDQRNFRIFEVIRNDNARFDHLVVKVVTFTCTLTNAREHGHTRVHLRDVVDQFHDENCFTNTRTAEQTNLTTLRVRREKVDNLNACHEDFRFSCLIFELWCLAVDRTTCVRFNWALLVNWFTSYVHDATQCSGTNWHGDWSVSVSHSLTAHQTFCRVHSDGTYGVFTKVLRYFKNKVLAIVVCCQRVQNRWQIAIELNVHNGADHLSDFAICFCHFRFSGFLQRFRAGNNFNQLVGDDCLTGSVVFDCQFVDHFASIAGRVIHGGHTCTLLRCAVL